MKRSLSILCVVAGLLMLPAGASAASILGTVTPVAAAPEVEVCVVEALPSETCTTPAPNGTYQLTGLPLRTDIRVEFIPSYRSHYVTQYYRNVRSVAEATVFRFSEQFSVQEHVDAALELGGAIEGTVTASGGGALSEVEVCVLQAGTRAASGCTTTDGAGNYALGGLPAAAYKLGFWGRGAAAEYAPRYYVGKATLAEGTVVNVPAGATVTERDESLVKGAKVSGTVTAATNGAALDGISVCLFAASSSFPSRCSFSGPAGAYSFVGLTAGAYQVGFSLGSAEIGGEAVSAEDDNYLTQYYRGVANRPEAQVLTLSGEQSRPGIDASLLTPTILAPVGQLPPPATNVVEAPKTVTVPVKPKPVKCKKGFVKKTVKGAQKCVKKPVKKKKKHHKAPKKHDAKSTKNGARRR